MRFKNYTDYQTATPSSAHPPQPSHPSPLTPFYHPHHLSHLTPLSFPLTPLPITITSPSPPPPPPSPPPTTLSKKALEATLNEAKMLSTRVILKMLHLLATTNSLLHRCSSTLEQFNSTFESGWVDWLMGGQ